MSNLFDNLAKIDIDSRWFIPTMVFAPFAYAADSTGGRLVAHVYNAGAAGAASVIRQARNSVGMN